ncbi:uncharacterized protein LOC112572504 [Pomacea canaliculata]|uniref:uncharacterized protein LOC112572504 n=1 Tax=Pomacea canaliculata TaxID=400727 RepID=UPI000D7373D8|nr:uncharacterized protein LOC112572504 [Pomacea canaliculata]
MQNMMPHLAETSHPTAAVSQVLMVWLLLTHVMAYSPQCTLPPTIGPGPLRPSVSPQFTVRVEAVLLEQNRTEEFVEYFDYTNNRGRLTQMRSGHVTDFYYNYGTNEMFIVQPDTYDCQVQPLSSSPLTILLGDTPQGHVFSPAGALRFGENGSREEYLGRTQVRDIAVNQWRSCLNWTEDNATMTVVWSFMDTDVWQASGSAMSIPVECHVTGTMYGHGSSTAFEHLYEFINYVEGLPPESDNVFETPSGVVCPGRRNTKPFPVMPDALSFTAESLDEEGKSVTYTTELYDSLGRVAAYKFRGATIFARSYGLNPLVIVHDFATGTEYVVDQLQGNCTISPLTTTPDVGHVAKDPVLLRINSAKEMFQMTGNYTYVGVRTIRGVPCDVWATRLVASDLLGISVNATREWAFSSTEWKTEDSVSAMFISGIPMQTTTTLDDFGARQTVVTNVYDYAASVPDVATFVNLDSCYIGMPRNRITFSISRVYKSLLESFEARFKYTVRQNIASAISLSPLRVANIQYTVQDTSLDITFDLLPVPRMHSRVDSPREELDLDNATQLLMAAVKNNKMVFELQGGCSMPVYIAVDATSMRVTPLGQPSSAASARVTSAASNLPPTSPTTATAATGNSSHEDLCAQPGHDPTYSAGVMAGSAIAVGALGGALGGFVHRLVLRRAS